MPWTRQWPTTLTAHPEPFSRSRGQHIRLVNPSPERSSSWWWCCSSVTGTAHARLVHSVPWFTKPMLWYYWANSELLCSFVLWDVVGAKARSQSSMYIVWRWQKRLLHLLHAFGSSGLVLPCQSLVYFQYLKVWGFFSPGGSKLVTLLWGLLVYNCDCFLMWFSCY